MRRHSTTRWNEWLQSVCCQCGEDVLKGLLSRLFCPFACAFWSSPAILPELQKIPALCWGIFKFLIYSPENDATIADQNMVTFITGASTVGTVFSLGEDMFPMLRGGLKWGNDNKLLNLRLLLIERHSSLTPLEGLTEKGGLIVFAAGRSPMGRIDHQLVKYRPSECWQLLMLVAVDIQALSLLLSPSLSFTLSFISSLFPLISVSVSHTHNRLTTCKRQTALSFILTRINIFWLYSALWANVLPYFVFFPLRVQVWGLVFGDGCVCCVYGIVFVCVKASVCICARESIPIISDLLANWKIPSILPSRHP